MVRQQPLNPYLYMALVGTEAEVARAIIDERVGTAAVIRTSHCLDWSGTIRMMIADALVRAIAHLRTYP